MFRVVGIVLLASINSLAAEPGDLDGDGRLSLLDALHFRDGGEIAPGSMDGVADALLCRVDLTFERLLYLEALRRSVPDGLPDWRGLWSESPQNDALEADPRVSVGIASFRAAGGEHDRVHVEIDLSTSVELRAFSLILDGRERGLLRTIYDPSAEFLWDAEWGMSWESSSTPFHHDLGEKPAYAFASAQLATNGRFVLSYFGPPLLPGEYRVTAEARLPKGTSAGEYALELLNTSEIVTTSGELLSPTLLDGGRGTLTVVERIRSGWDESLPPLDIDASDRAIQGDIEFLVTSAEGFPGETVDVELRMRTEVPLNHIDISVQFPGRSLECATPNDELSVFESDEEGEPYQGTLWCHESHPFFGWGSHGIEFSLAGHQTNSEQLYSDRLFEYFKPLDEWITISRLSFNIPESSEGGTEIPLVFRKYDWDKLIEGGENSPGPPAQFYPYSSWYRPCGAELWPSRENWTYSYVYHDGLVRVLGDNVPPPPETDAGIELRLGAATGSPGDLVEVPVLAANRENLSLLRLALSADPRLSIEAIDVEIQNLRDDQFVRSTVARRVWFQWRECNWIKDPSEVENPQCWRGIPWFVQFRETDPDKTVVDFKVRASEKVETDWPGPALREIARLHVRIREDADPGVADIDWAATEFSTGAVTTPAEPGGYLESPDQDLFAPARFALGAQVTIRERGFLRGDSNADGNFDVSDAIATLGFLFLGSGEPGCRDAADADDSGDLSLTDAIVSLGSLFLGRGALPEPYPMCGVDPTKDELSCHAVCN